MLSNLTSRKPCEVKVMIPIKKKKRERKLSLIKGNYFFRCTACYLTWALLFLSSSYFFSLCSTGPEGIVRLLFLSVKVSIPEDLSPPSLTAEIVRCNICEALIFVSPGDYFFVCFKDLNVNHYGGIKKCQENEQMWLCKKSVKTYCHSVWHSFWFPIRHAILCFYSQSCLFFFSWR